MSMPMNGGGVNGGMDFMQMMQTQIITMTGMKDGGNMLSVVIGMMLLNLCNEFIKYIPTIKNGICNLISKYYEKKKVVITKKINSITKQESKGNILFEKPKTDRESIIIQALMNYISNLKSAKDILYNTEFYVINDKEFLLENEIYCKVKNFERDDKGLINQYNFEIYSYKHDVNELKKFVNKILESYKRDCENKLGDKIYYFDELHVSLPKQMGGGYNYSMAPKHLTFEITPFYTNKSLSNIFGSHLDVLKKRIDIFVNNQEIYAKKGNAHTLGILLSGPPGTGKTSAIKAIAKDTHRHIFNIKLSKTTTQTQLKNLFYNQDVRIIRNEQTEILNIPNDKRIYVLEDIDALGDVVKKRSLIEDDDSDEGEQSQQQQQPQQQQPQTMMYDPGNYATLDYSMSYLSTNNNTNTNNDTDNNDTNNNTNNDTNNNTNTNTSNKKKKKDNVENPDEITLSFLLNLFDGIMETPGRIMIMTSNHPEQLDPALIRSGRVDIKLNVGNCTKEMIYEMFQFYYEKKDLDFEFEYDNELTPADVASILQNNFDDHIGAIDELISKTK